MHALRGWAPPALLGLVVAFLGIGTVEVAGVAPRLGVTAPVATAEPIERQQSPAPAAIEADELRADPVSALPEATVTPRAPEEPAASEEPTARRTSTPTPAPAPATRPTPTLMPSPSPTPKAIPTPKLSASPAPIAPPAPSPPPPPPPTRPAQVLDLRPWKLTLPVGRQGHPLEVLQPALSAAGNSAFFLLQPDRGVRFRAPVGGVTTENSKYPRAELREMTPDGRRKAAWSSTAGRHVMTISQAITATPRAKPHVVAGQIHDAEDDIIMIRLEGRRLFAESDGDDVGLLDPNYRLGTKFTLSIVASPAGIRVTHQTPLRGSSVVDVRKAGHGWYFKAGCYPQSNPDRGDHPSAYGEVVIYALTVRHS
jgi:outer membrane biosynthesis protein TonB